MQIQNLSTTNFKATKVLSAQRNLAKNKQELIEVFKLDEHSDTDFIKKCYQLLSSRKTRDLPLYQRKLKIMFESFLNKANAMSEDFYIAIKNNEKFIGIMNSVPFYKDNFALNLFTSKDSAQNASLMALAFLNDSQNSYKGFDLNLKHISKMLPLSNFIIKEENIDNAKLDVRAKIPDTLVNFEQAKDIDLDDILDTKDFETEAYPNLK